MTSRIDNRWLQAGCAILAALSSFLTPRPAGAAPTRWPGHGAPPLTDSLEGGGRGDGVYGRFDGPFAVSLGAGVDADLGVGVARPSALAALRFYQSIGLTVNFAQAVDDGDPLERTLAVSALLEPLFLVRWSGDHEWGRPLWDLIFDSISVTTGAVFAEPRAGSFGDEVAFRLGLGAGVPLLARASGPWLRLGARMDAGLSPNVSGGIFAHLEWQWVIPSGRAD